MAPALLPLVCAPFLGADCAQAASLLRLTRPCVFSKARGDPGASRHASLFDLDAPPSSCSLCDTRLRSLLEVDDMENEQIEHLMQEIDEEFDLEAFEQDLIAEYGSLEAAILDMSDRPY